MPSESGYRNVRSSPSTSSCSLKVERFGRVQVRSVVVDHMIVLVGDDQDGYSGDWNTRFTETTADGGGDTMAAPG